MRRTLLLAFFLNRALLAVTPGPDAVPLFFIPNQGQAASPVRFMVKGSGLTAHLLPGEIELRIAGLHVSMRFEGANPGHRVEGNQALPGRVNFLTGSEADWRVDLPVYGSVVYRELYPGIDMEYGAAGRYLKSEFLVAAGADASRIRVRYVGAGDPWIDGDGSLVVPVEGTELRERAPLVYQERAGVRQLVAGRFLIHSDGTVGFWLGDYDTARPLVIDPVLSYSTLLGGSGFDSAMALAVDASGSAYVAGFTDSVNFPATNPVQNFNGGGNDVFVAKLSPGGNALVYCTYLGGSADDRASAIAVDAQGSAYITGSTTSRNFPVRFALQPKLAGYRNAFVVKLSPAGNSLVYSTYLGGNASDAGNGIAVDASGAAYVVGDTTSFSFPASGLQRGTHGGQDAFVAKLSADGASLVYSTYLGGSSEDHGAAIAVDSGGTVYVTGATTSTDFPVLNAAQRYNAGGQDAFVTRLSADGNYLLFSTYLGGSGGTVMYPEIGQAIALDMNGNAYVTGVTSSPNFPLAAALQTTRKGALDAFVTKVNPSGATVYSTYLGGSSVDVGNAIAVDAGGAAYIVGYTISTDLAVVNALQSVNAGEYDAFLARLSPAGDVVHYLSYLGGNGSDSATAVALDPAANVYLAGYTLSTNFPLRNAYQASNAGNYGGFVVKIDFSGLQTTAVLRIAATHTGGFVQGAASAGYTVTVTNQPAAWASTGTVTVTDTLPAGLTLVSMTGAGWACGGNSCARSDALAGGASYPAITVTVAVSLNAASPQVNSVTVSGGGSDSATATDSTPIGISAVLGIGSTHGGSFTQGQSGTYTVTVSNRAGAGATSGIVTVTETVPAGLTLVSMAGSGWACGGNACMRSDALAGGASYPAIAVTVNVGASAVSPQVNSVTVSGGGVASATATDSTNLSCTYQLSGNAVYGPLAASGAVTVTALASCGWTASVNVSWLHIAAALTGSGSAQLGYSVDANPTSVQRSGALTVANQSITVLQGGSAGQTGAGLRFVPATPCRIADTRSASGPFGGPAVGPSALRDFEVLASACGIPATARAYSLNLTVVPLGPLGALYVWPAGQPQPPVANLSSTDGRIKADMAIVPAGGNGAISVLASDPTHFIVDINGYFVPAAGTADLAFYPVTPCRLVETRIGTGPLAGPAIVPSQIRAFPVLSSPCNIPAEARAYALNLTVVPSASFGFLSIWPAGSPQPVVSTLNAPTGAVTANAAIVPAGANGAIAVIASHATQLVIDINGYFAPPGTGGLQFYPQTPCRIADTRNSDGHFGGPRMESALRRDFLVTGSSCAVPLTAAAYSLNATVVPPAGLGFLSLWGAGPQPVVSTLNAGDGATTANSALVPAGFGGYVSAFSANPTHLLLDINGYFAP